MFVGDDVSVIKGFPTWRRWVRGGLVHLGRLTVESSTPYDHVVVPREGVHVVDIALPVSCSGQN